MKQSIYSQLFSKLGLSDTQAKIYEFLLKNGTKTAGEISKKTEVKRGLTYNALSELEKKGIISQNIKTKVATFTPNHPEALREYIETKEKEVRDTKLSLESILPNIISDFNTISEKPGVRYLEGYIGVEKAFTDFLKETKINETILNFCNIEDYAKDKELLKLGNKYFLNRLDKKIFQKTIISNKEKHLATVNKTEKEIITKGSTLEEIMFLDKKQIFKTDIMLYKDNTLLVGAKNNKPFAIFIENKEISETLKSIFDIIWEKNKNTVSSKKKTV